MFTTATKYWRKIPKSGVVMYYKTYSFKTLSECQKLCRDDDDCHSIDWSTARCLLSHLTADTAVLVAQPLYDYYEYVVVNGA